MNGSSVYRRVSAALPGAVASWRTPATVLAAGVLAWAVGWYAAARSPLLIGSALLAVAGGAVALRDLRIALGGTIAVIALLPFGVLPIRLGAAPTLLELALATILVGWIARRAATGQGQVHLTVAGPWIALLLATLLAAHIAALAQGNALSVVRALFKIELAILFYFACVNLAADAAWRRLIVRYLLIFGALQAMIALVLFVAPRHLAFRALVTLGRFGYPTDSTVLRFLPDTDRLRATGTAIDPNVLGAFLMIVGVIAITQLVAAQPVMPRRWLSLVLILVLPALLVTYSRSSWIGLVSGVALAAIVRYRRLLLAMAAAAIGFVLWPTTQRYALHLLSGLRAQDRAAAMRLGEIENAWQIIQAYPWLGIGFGGAPAIDLFPGVSNIFLTMAQQAGIIGLIAYVGAIGVVVGTGGIAWWRGRELASADFLLSVLAALAAALVAGMLDHHFVRLPHLVALFWGLGGLAVAAAGGLHGPHPRRDQPAAVSAQPSAAPPC